MSKQDKLSGLASPATLSHCVGCRQAVLRALQQGQLLPESAYTQLQGQANANGWEQTPATVQALVEQRQWQTRG